MTAGFRALEIQETRQMELRSLEILERLSCDHPLLDLEGVQHSNKSFNVPESSP